MKQRQPVDPLSLGIVRRLRIGSFGLVVLLLLSSVPASAEPVVLGTIRMAIANAYTDVHTRFSWGGVAAPSLYLFDLDLPPSAVGSTFVVDSGSAFDFAADKLTDGVNNGMWVYWYVGGPQGSSGMQWDTEYGIWHTSSWGIYTTYLGANGGDFRGYEITNFSIRVDSLNSSFFDVTFSIYGTHLYDPPPYELSVVQEPCYGDCPVPAPDPGSTLLLLGIGLAGLRVGRKRWQ